MADRTWNLLDEMDQRRKIVEKKMGWSLDPVDWFLNSDQILHLVLERFPELLQELSSPPPPSPSSDKPTQTPPPISDPPPEITVEIIQTSNPPQSPLISPLALSKISQTPTVLQTPHNSNCSPLTKPPPQTPSQSMPPIDLFPPPKPLEPPNEFEPSDFTVHRTNKGYRRPSKVRFRAQSRRKRCHSSLAISTTFTATAYGEHAKTPYWACYFQLVSITQFRHRSNHRRRNSSRSAVFHNPWKPLVSTKLRNTRQQPDSVHCNYLVQTKLFPIYVAHRIKWKIRLMFDEVPKRRIICGVNSSKWIMAAYVQKDRSSETLEFYHGRSDGIELHSAAVHLVSILPSCNALKLFVEISHKAEGAFMPRINTSQSVEVESLCHFSLVELRPAASNHVQLGTRILGDMRDDSFCCQVLLFYAFHNKPLENFIPSERKTRFKQPIPHFQSSSKYVEVYTIITRHVAVRGINCIVSLIISGIALKDMVQRKSDASSWTSMDDFAAPYGVTWDCYFTAQEPTLEIRSKEESLRWEYVKQQGILLIMPSVYSKEVAQNLLVGESRHKYEFPLLSSSHFLDFLFQDGLRFKWLRKIQAISLLMNWTSLYTNVIALAHNGAHMATCIVMGMMCQYTGMRSHCAMPNSDVVDAQATYGALVNAQVLDSISHWAEEVKKLVAIIPTHCQLFIIELAYVVQNWNKLVMEELHKFGEAEKAPLNTTSRDRAAIISSKSKPSSSVAGSNLVVAAVSDVEGMRTSGGKQKTSRYESVVLAFYGGLSVEHKITIAIVGMFCKAKSQLNKILLNTCDPIKGPPFVAKAYKQFTRAASSTPKGILASLTQHLEVKSDDGFAGIDVVLMKNILLISILEDKDTFNGWALSCLKQLKKKSQRVKEYSCYSFTVIRSKRSVCS